MHTSIWKFTGDPEELVRSYDALAAAMPTAEFIAHLCLLAPDGIIVIDTCPTEEDFRAFATSDEFRSARREHGLPEPTELRDYPVHAIFTSDARHPVGE
jgi:hypothetical protein